MSRQACAAAPLLALALIATQTATAVWAAPVAGVVIAVQGKPLLRKAGRQEFGALKRDAFIYEGDMLKTGAQDRAAVAFTGGAEVRLAENSNFTVEAGGGRGATLLRTAGGQAWTRLLHGLAGLEIRTPEAVCSVRGTEADVESRERLTVKVYDGHVDVFNDKGRQSLFAGQMTQVAGAQSAPQPPREMGAGEKGTWQDAIKTGDAQRQLERLRKEAAKNRDVDLEFSHDGKSKKVKLHLQKK
jgi:hypothetical protein